MTFSARQAPLRGVPHENILKLRSMFWGTLALLVFFLLWLIAPSKRDSDL